MTDNKDPRSEVDLEQEIRQGRKFTPQDAVARLAGPGAMKGASPVSPQQQAETEIGNWLKRNVSDPAGALHAVLHRSLEGSELLLTNLERPLFALACHCNNLLQSDFLLGELVREADMEWGRRMDERPQFDCAGQPARPGDPYTAESVRNALRQVIERLEVSKP